MNNIRERLDECIQAAADEALNKYDTVNIECTNSQFDATQYSWIITLLINDEITSNWEVFEISEGIVATFLHD